MKSMKKSLLGAAVAAALGFAATAHAGVVIDLFQDPVGGRQEVSVTALGATANNQTGPFPTSGVIGGYRDLSVNKTGGANSNQAQVAVENGTLFFSNGGGVTSRGVVTWDGSNNAGVDGLAASPTGFGGMGVDLTAGGSANQFLADILAADLGFNYSITVWDMDGDKSTLSAGVQFAVTSTVSSNYLFNWFNLASGQYCDGVTAPPTCANPATQLDFQITRMGGLIDFTRIGAIQLTVEGAEARLDLDIGTIRTVPEPGVLALAGMALMGAGLASRRRTAKKA